MANKGMLPSVLGVDGYNPSAVQYDVDGSAASNSTTSSSAPNVASAPVATIKKNSSGGPPPIENPTKAVEQALETLARYRTGGDGGAAMKLLCTFMKNIVENPDESKYRSIKSDSKAFQSKLTPLVGPVMILRAVGFVKNEEGNYVLELGNDMGFLQSTYAKLIAAEEKYRRDNP